MQYLLVPAGLYGLITNAFTRDVEQGRTIRGEILQELTQCSLVELSKAAHRTLTTSPSIDNILHQGATHDSNDRLVTDRSDLSHPPGQRD